MKTVKEKEELIPTRKDKKTGTWNKKGIYYVLKNPTSLKHLYNP